MSIVTNGDEISLMFSVSDGSPSMYLRVAYTGRYELTVWNTTASAWTVIEEHPGAGCDRYASCGAFGYCDVTEAVPRCKCLDGFELSNGNGTGPSGGGGCRRKEPLRCGDDGDYFATLRGGEDAGDARVRQEQKHGELHGGVPKQLLVHGLRLHQLEHSLKRGRRFLPCTNCFYLQRVVTCLRRLTTPSVIGNQ
jgi:hypothetical protein